MEPLLALCRFPGPSHSSLRPRPPLNINEFAHQACEHSIVDDEVCWCWLVLGISGRLSSARCSAACCDKPPTTPHQLRPLTASSAPQKTVSASQYIRRNILIITPPPTGERSIVMSVSVFVCLSVRDHISGTTRPIFEQVSNKCIAVRKVATPLRQLTCHTGSHSVTCHPAEVTFPPLPQPKLVLD